MKRPNLTRQLTLEAPQQAADGAGGFSTNWAALGTLWADVRPGSGRERAGRAGAVSRVPMKIIVRGAPDGASNRPKPDQRFREGSRVYAILAVSDYGGAGQYLVCHTEEERAA